MPRQAPEGVVSWIRHDCTLGGGGRKIGITINVEFSLVTFPPWVQGGRRKTGEKVVEFRGKACVGVRASWSAF
jgi:hypothetical protein